MPVKLKKHQTVKDRLLSLLEAGFKQHTISHDSLVSIIKAHPKNTPFLLVCIDPQLTVLKVIFYKFKCNSVTFQYGVTKSKVEVSLSRYLEDWYLIPASSTTLKLYDSINNLENTVVP